MSGWALRKTIDNFEWEWNNDSSHMRDMLDTSPRAAWLVSRVIALLVAAALIGGFGLSHRRRHRSPTSRPPLGRDV